MKARKSQDPALSDISAAKWFRALDAAHKRAFGYGFESEEFGEDSCEVEAAAAILGDPLPEAFASLVKGGVG